IIAGNRSTDIAYAGTALAVDGSIYYWRVRFWDDDDYQGEWSAPAASFRMSSSPGSSDVTSVTARTVETWYQEGAFAFSSTALNAGDVAYYCYVWDRSGVTSVDDNPPNCTVATGQGKWSSGDLSFSDTLLYNSKNIYLHVLAYNADDQADPSGTQSYGPFYFVNTSRILHGGKFFDDDGNLIELGWKGQ
ncbi:MAG: hypothetical protein Q8L21_03455, partial [Candidatus Komeilibacteria bacterium]|nr:hypothetical protein [Candidatus Komeilibacteria bacterium]